MSYGHLRKAEVPITNNLSYLTFDQLMEHVEFNDFFYSYHGLKLSNGQIVAMLEQFNTIDNYCYGCGLRYSCYDSNIPPDYSLCIYCHSKRTQYGICQMQPTDKPCEKGDMMVLIWWFKEDGDLLYVRNYDRIIDTDDSDRLHLYGRGMSRMDNSNKIKYIPVQLGDVGKEATIRVLSKGLPYHAKYEDHNSSYIVGLAKYIVEKVDFKDLLYNLVESDSHDMIRGAAASKIPDLELHRSLNPLIKRYVRKYVLFEIFRQEKELTETIDIAQLYTADWKSMDPDQGINPLYKRIFKRDEYQFDKAYHMWRAPMRDQDFLRYVIDNGYQEYFRLKILRYLDDLDYVKIVLDNIELDDDIWYRHTFVEKLSLGNRLGDMEIVEYMIDIIDTEDEYELFKEGGSYHITISQINDKDLLIHLLMNIDNINLPVMIFNMMNNDQVLIKDILNCAYNASFLGEALARIKDSHWVIEYMLGIPEEYIRDTFDCLQRDLYEVGTVPQDLIIIAMDSTHRDKRDFAFYYLRDNELILKYAMQHHHLLSSAIGKLNDIESLERLRDHPNIDRWSKKLDRRIAELTS